MNLPQEAIAAVRAVCSDFRASQPDSVFATLADLIDASDALLQQQKEEQAAAGQAEGKGSVACWVVGAPCTATPSAAASGASSKPATSLASFAPPLKRASAKGAVAAAVSAAGKPGASGKASASAGAKKPAAAAKPSAAGAAAEKRKKGAAGAKLGAFGGAFGDGLAAVRALADEYKQQEDAQEEAEGEAVASAAAGASGRPSDDTQDGAASRSGGRASSASASSLSGAAAAAEEAEAEEGDGADEEEEDEDGGAQGGGGGARGKGAAGGGAAWEADVWALLKKKAGLDKLLRAKPSTAEFGNWCAAEESPGLASSFSLSHVQSCLWGPGERILLR